MNIDEPPLRVKLSRLKNKLIKRINKNSGKIKLLVLFFLLGIMLIANADTPPPQYMDEESINIESILPQRVPITINPNINNIETNIETNDDTRYNTNRNIIISNIDISGSNYVEMEVEVTGFNSLEAQTDSTPCVGAGGYICGRSDVVACSRSIPLGSIIEIDNKKYVCLDRLSERFDNRVDIFFDKDIEAALHWGKQIKTIKVWQILK